MSTGEIEVCAESIEVLNTSRKLPFEIKEFVKVSECLFIFIFIFLAKTCCMSFESILSIIVFG